MPFVTWPFGGCRPDWPDCRSRGAGRRGVARLARWVNRLGISPLVVQSWVVVGRCSRQTAAMKIALTSLPVHDPPRAFAFYTQVLGFTEKVYLPEANLAIVVSPEDPDGTALLLEPNDNPITKDFQAGVYAAGLPIIIFGVTDLEAEYHRLKAAGVVFRGEPETTEWGKQVLLDDTCGNLVQLHQG